MKPIILDRDGVINIDTGYISKPEDWKPINGSLEAIAKLTQAGYTVFVITNQSGIGRGYYTDEDLAAIHKKMHSQVEKVGGKIERVYHCPHKPDDNCECRKPKPGMFEQLAKEYGIDLNKDIYYIGDKLTDIEAALNANCTPIFIGEREDKTTLAYTSLQQAVDDILTTYGNCNGTS